MYSGHVAFDKERDTIEVVNNTEVAVLCFVVPAPHGIDNTPDALRAALPDADFVTRRSESALTLLHHGVPRTGVVVDKQTTCTFVIKSSGGGCSPKNEHVDDAKHDAVATNYPDALHPYRSS